MIIYLGCFYVFIGTIILLVPLIYIELGRPRDLIKASLNLIIGMLLLLKDKTLDITSTLILIFLSLIIIFYLVEIFSVRWNQLTDQEKNKIKTFTEFKKNISLFSKAISLVGINFLNFINISNINKNNKNLIKKKWVRNDENGNILPSNPNKLITLEMPTKSSNSSKEDIINEIKKD